MVVQYNLGSVYKILFLATLLHLNIINVQPNAVILGFVLLHECVYSQCRTVCSVCSHKVFSKALNRLQISVVHKPTSGLSCSYYVTLYIITV